MSAAVFDFGWHRMPNGRQSLLSWYPDCGAVMFDGPGGFYVLGFIKEEAEVRRRLEGWEEVTHEPNALAWARAAVAGRAVQRDREVAPSRPAAAGGPAP